MYGIHAVTLVLKDDSGSGYTRVIVVEYIKNTFVSCWIH